VSSEDRPAGAVATTEVVAAEMVGVDTVESDVTESDTVESDVGGSDVDGSDVAGSDAAESVTAHDRVDRSGGDRRRMTGTRGGSRSLILSLAVTVILALVGGALMIRTAQLRDDPVIANQALVDTAANTQVIGDVSNALTKVFSYSYTDTATTEQAARDVLAGVAYRQYETLFSQVVREAPSQELTVRTRVVRAGVIRLTGDTAQLLVFLDQAVTRRGDPAGTTAAAQLSITAQLRDGHWRITDIQSR
jgi:Mce-associated membrane protein